MIKKELKEIDIWAPKMPNSTYEISNNEELATYLEKN